MGLQDKFKKICMSLGNDNDAVYAVLAIAVVKGIARPIFTMMDEKEDHDTKKYAAIREGLTEVIAVPSYFLMSKLTKSLAIPLTKNMPQKMQDATKTLSFIGVCVTALFVIPALCSAAIKPVMDRMAKKTKNEDHLVLNNPIDKPQYQQPIKPIVSPVFSTFKGYNSNMRVGG